MLTFCSPNVSKIHTGETSAHKKTAATKTNMRVKVTETQGINENKSKAALPAKSGPLALNTAVGFLSPKPGSRTAPLLGGSLVAPKDKRHSFDRAALIRAIFLELRLLQSQGAQFVFEARYAGDFSATGRDKSKDTKSAAPAVLQGSQAAAMRTEARETDHFSLLKLADFLILGQGGKTLLLKVNQKKGGQAFRSSWHSRLMSLGHAIAYLECETPLDGREQLRKLMHRQGYISDAPQSTAKAKAQALFS
jgi:hypothetical protein